MKRRDLERHLRNHGVKLIREGARHSVWGWNAGDMTAYRGLLDAGCDASPAPGVPGVRAVRGSRGRYGRVLGSRDTWDFDVAEPISDFIEVAGPEALRWLHGAPATREARHSAAAVLLVA